MSLPALQWRKLPTRNLSNITSSVITSTILLNAIYDIMTGSVYSDGSSRVMGTNSAWKNPFKFVTGSNTEAVGIFPPTLTVMSQSVIFSGTNVTGASSSAFPPTMSFEVFYTSSCIHVACVKNAESASFTQWTSRFPFGSGSSSTGYARFKNLSGLNKSSNITIYESKEAIAAFTYDYVNNVTNLIVAGSIIDPEQTSTSVDAETDGRLYGVATVGTETASTPTGIYNSVTQANSTGFYHDNRSSLGNNFGAGKAVVFTPQSGSVTNFFRISPFDYNTNVTAAVPNFKTKSDKIVDVPVQNLTSGSLYYLGRTRDITVTAAANNVLSNTVLKNPDGSINGYTVGTSEVSNAGIGVYIFKYS